MSQPGTAGATTPASDLLRELPGAAWLWDVAAGREIYSSEWKAMLGHADHEVGDSAAEWRARVHPDDLERAARTVRAALEPGAPPYQDEYRMRHKDGSWRRILSRGNVVERDAQGRGTRMAGVDHDLTAGGELARTLRERDAILTMAERVGGLGWWRWIAAEDSVTWSPGMYAAFGIDPSQPAPGFAAQAALFTPESFEKLQQAATVAMTTGQTYLLELEVVRPDGARRTIIGIGEVITDARGMPAGMRGVMQDVTELQLVQRGAREQAQLLAEVSRIGRIGGWAFDVIGNSLSWTDETYRIHDLEPGQRVDMAAALDFYVGASREQVAEAVRRALDDGTPFDLQARVRTAKGRENWVRSQGVAERVRGRTVRIYGTFRDVSAEIEAEQRLAAVMDDLRVRNRQLQEFAYVASHDLQEPLRKIRAFSSLLRERSSGALDAQAVDWIERMVGAAARMSDLVDDLLAYSRVDSTEGRLVEVDLAKVLRNVLEELDARIAESGGAVSCGELPVLRADPTQMFQLLQNLVGNAIKYRDPARAPLVRIEHEPAMLPMPAPAPPRPGVRLRVVDNGIGFDNRHAELIFAPFQRLHDRSRYPGTGIGLAIVRRIAERHGGRAFATSVPGEGSTFVVELPLDGAGD